MEVVRLLLEANADTDKARNDVASEQSHLEVFRLWLEASADTDKARFDDVTPLCLASAIDHLEVVCLFLEANAETVKVCKQQELLYMITFPSIGGPKRKTQKI